MGDKFPAKSGNDGGKKNTSPSKTLGTDAASSEGAVVVHSSSSRGGVPIHYPQLTDTNYGVRAVKMKIILRSLRPRLAAVCHCVF
jgi:hypothetical protein